MTPQIRLARVLGEQALRDDLTGLPNRAAWNEELKRAVARANRAPAPLTVMFLDLDGFKAVNDEYGHAAGDLVLVTFADVLRRHLRASDFVARLSGDEFVVLLDGISDTDHDPMRIAKNIMQVTSEATSFEGHAIRVSASIGIAIQRGPNFNAAQLLRCADDAMYAAKRTGRGEILIRECSTADPEDVGA